MAELLLPYLLSVLQRRITSMSAQELEKLFLLVYMLVKSLSCLEATNPELVRATLQQPLSSWIGIFVDVLSNSPSVALQKYTAKTLTCMLADLPELSGSHLTALVYPIWRLFNRSVAQYLTDSMHGSKPQQENVVEDKYLKEIRFEESTSSEGLVYQLVELVSTLFCSKGLETLQRLALHLLFNSFYNLLLIT